MMTRLKLILAWLARWNTLWVFLGGMVLAVVVADWVGCRSGLVREESLPYAGWFLEMLGVMTVFLGIGDRLKSFNKDGLMARAAALLREFPLRRQDNIVKLPTGELNLVGESVTVHITSDPAPDASLEQRVERLEKLANDLRDAIKTDRQRLKELVTNLESRLEDEVASIHEEIATVQSQSERALVGQFGWEYAGLGWIMVGLTFATVPKLVVPIIELFDWIPCW